MPERPEEFSSHLFASGLAGHLFEARLIMLSGPIDEASAARVTGQLAALAAASEEAIKIVVSAREGDHASGLAIYDAIRYIGPHVRLVGSGRVGGAGTLMFVSVPKEDRYCLPNTHFLLSQPRGAAGGSAQEMSGAAEQVAHLRARMHQILARQTGQPPERIEADLRRGDLWLTAEEAEAYGLVGHVVERSGEVP